ncbi:recombination factor protein RarA [Bacteroides sp. CAG:530]|nr:recombination factor protein RarA [Bacteroides sp. CAG:530]
MKRGFFYAILFASILILIANFAVIIFISFVYMAQPLAERMRPKTLDDYIGQKHLVGEGAVLRRMIDSGRISSFILWGPPGVGKTTLAQIIANRLETPFYTLSAVTSGVKDVRDVIEKARSNRFFSQQSPILFIDEIHRFSKSQQDSLLGAVETGTVTLIGATTENPSFEVIRPLLSRCQLYVLKSLEKEDLLELLHHAVEKDVILREKHIELQETDAMLRYSGGDARKLLNILELVVEAEGDTADIVITDEKVMERLQQNPLAYDKDGEMHYDIISAFIKSIRGSDPDGALYWLARMVEGGEDPAFIARRLVISAAEDIGLANPNALLLANAAFDAVMKIGWPEGRIPLAEATVYLATSPKSNSAYEGIGTALSLVQQTGNLPVPLHLRNAPTKLMKQLGYGKDYKYAHAYKGNFVQQQFLPDDVQNQRIWHAQDNPAEAKLKDRMVQLWGERFEK